MEDLELRREYWGDADARAAFKAFLREIHGLDLGAWDSAGCWDDCYVPFSLFDRAGRVVSSVCVYSMPAVVAGRKTRLAQISGVGTHPDHRRRGHCTRLTQEALAWARQDHEAFFLFADEGAVEYYRNRGFTPVREYVHRIPLPRTAPATTLQPVDLEDPTWWARLVDIAHAREPASRELSTRTPKLLLFHALYALKDACRYSAELDAFVFAREAAGRLVVYDVVARRMPTAEELLPRIAPGGIAEAEFRFPIDRLRPEGARAVELTGENPFVLGPPIWPEPLVFPFTSRA